MRNRIVISSSFDPALEIVVADHRDKFAMEHPVYLWNIHKWTYDPVANTKKTHKLYSLRDLFLIEDLIKTAKDKLRDLYKPIFVAKVAKSRGVAEVLPQMWNMDLSGVDFNEDQDDIVVAPVKYPWEA